MEDSSQPIHHARDIAIDFLLADLDLALTFMNVAHTSHNQETVKRNHANARSAYDTVLRHLPTLKPTGAQQQAIDEKLADLKARLEAVREEF